ncbi:hypothetical protein [Streptomyces sp. SID3212]|uniref:hypothetical protein n=1 Tax=Streptomyces sp. SID3212 TaxID=2690259 RepID=UPI001369F00C|nr:hypothetical protein [Streptomyces sp. SID3212]MYV58005.1 hypothetical protein [Streptomyces sp. SID3212]
MAEEINRELLAELFEQKRKAGENKNQWLRYEKQTTAKILGMLGYERDPKTRPADTVIKGVLRVEVKPITRMDLDYLRENYPQIAAECERTSYTTYIRPPE